MWSARVNESGRVNERSCSYYGASVPAVCLRSRKSSHPSPRLNLTGCSQLVGGQTFIPSASSISLSLSLSFSHILAILLSLSLYPSCLCLSLSVFFSFSLSIGLMMSIVPPADSVFILSSLLSLLLLPPLLLSLLPSLFPLDSLHLITHASSARN